MGNIKGRPWNLRVLGSSFLDPSSEAVTIEMISSGKSKGETAASVFLFLFEGTRNWKEGSRPAKHGCQRPRFF